MFSWFLGQNVILPSSSSLAAQITWWSTALVTRGGSLAHLIEPTQEYRHFRACHKISTCLEGSCLCTSMEACVKKGERGKVSLHARWPRETQTPSVTFRRIRPFLRRTLPYRLRSRRRRRISWVEACRRSRRGRHSPRRRRGNRHHLRGSRHHHLRTFLLRRHGSLLRHRLRSPPSLGRICPLARRERR